MPHPGMYKIRGADNREYGPVDADGVREWIAQRRIIAQTCLQFEGSTEWQPAISFPEFADALGAQPATAPVPNVPLPPRVSQPLAAGSSVPTTSGMAVASLVLGILGLFSCGISALIGLILGLVSLNQIRSSQGRVSGNGLAIAGICTSIFFLLFTIAAFCFFLSFGAAFTIPAANRASSASESAQCVNNLKQIGLAIHTWETEHGTLPPDLITLSNQLASPRVLICPGERLRERKRVSRWSDLNMIGSSYNYFKPRARITDPSAVLVSCPLHDKVCHADGSVSGK